MQRNYITMVITLLGSLKLILEMLFGVKITDVEFNAIADFVGAAATVVGIVLAHVKPVAAVVDAPVATPKADVQN